MKWRLDSETMDVMTAASKLVGELGGGELAERPRHSLDVLALFDRCRSLLGAIRLLLAHGFVHEAVMLGRPLFTDSLMLAEYASADERRRVELVIGWSIASLGAVEGLFRDAGSRGEDVAEALSKLAERRAELEEYARRHGAGSRSWQPDDHAKQLALKQGRGDEYTALLVANQFVHGATAAVSERYSQVTENTVEVGGPAVELETWARDAGLFAANSALHAARAACAIFGWEEPPELEALLRRIKAIIDAE